MKIKDLKIGTQLKIGFGIILLLITVLGTNSWWQAGRLAQQTSELHDHPFAVRRALGELKADILSIHRGMKDIALVEKKEEITLILQEIEKYKVDAFYQFEVLYDRYLGPPIDIKNTYDDFVKWNTIREETILLVQEGKAKEAIGRTKPTGPGGRHVNILLNEIQVIDNFATNKAESFYSGAIQLEKTLIGQTGILLVGILMLTVLITYLLNASIRRPLTELANFAQLFREGKTNVRSSYMSHNEFGKLSLSFNDLADTIETELTLNKKAAQLAAIMLSEEDAQRFCHALLKTLIEHTGSQMGAIYLLNDEKTEFEHFEGLGINFEGCPSFSAIHFDGEFGLALATKKIQYITKIPEDTRFKFSTVGGKFVPREIITIPIVSSNETIAVISLATIKSYSKNSLKLINNILSTLSARIDGILAYRKIITFSQQLEQQNSELEVQKRELSAQANELTGQNIELEMQKKQLDEANRLKTSFLSNMSHELRTPLNSVIALSGVLNRRLAGKVPEEEYSYLDVIERNGKQLLLLINDILDLSRIEAGHEMVEISRFNIGELVGEVVAMIEPQANQKNISLSFQIENDITDFDSDYQKCRHILQNLVANAVKFTEEGSVEILARTKDKTIQLIVSDTGIGIDEEHLPHIFDEFRQADGSNSRKYGGTGLGLAIVKKYVNMLGASIVVESIPNKGSRFTFSLPLHQAQQHTNVERIQPASLTQTSKARPYPEHANTKDKTILLVEDTEAIIIQLKDILTIQGYNIMVAHNGSEALEQIEQKVPDAMILDLMMPGVDGFEVLKRIREQEKTEHLPVIIITAKYVTKEELSFLKSNGILQLIHKGDINKNQLLEAVARMMFPGVEEPKAPYKKMGRVPVTGTPVVLVVEDNPDNMLTIKAMLEGKCTIIEAENGRTGIELAQLHQPHLILMDIALPGINGIETLKEIRRIENIRNIPVVAVSASAMKGDKEDFISFGFDGYIAKPIDNEMFNEVIKEFLG